MTKLKDYILDWFTTMLFFVVALAPELIVLLTVTAIAVVLAFTATL